MPTIRERDPSRPFSLTQADATLVRSFAVEGTNDPDEVKALALAASGTLYGNLVRKGVRGDPQGGGVWLVEVEYGIADPLQPAGGEEPPVEVVASAD